MTIPTPPKRDEINDPWQDRPITNCHGCGKATKRAEWSEDSKADSVMRLKKFACSQCGHNMFYEFRRDESRLGREVLK